MVIGNGQVSAVLTGSTAGAYYCAIDIRLIK